MTETTDTNQAIEPATDQAILVGIDFSEDSKAALIWACNYAECSGKNLILLHVVHDPVSSPGFYHKAQEEQMRPLQAVAESMMDDFLAQLRTRQPELSALSTAELRFVPGLPPSRIVEVADLLNADLIVVGNRGISGLPHILIGSVAERVVKLALGPVVVVKTEKTRKLRMKEIKRSEKKLKKERERVKDLLGLAPKPETVG